MTHNHDTAALRRRLGTFILTAGILSSLALAGCSSSSDGSSTTTSGPPTGTTATTSDAPPAPLRLRVHQLPARLSSPLSGEALTSSEGRLLIIGGLDQTGVSTGAVERFDPRTGKVASAGSLSEPLHDLAAATLGSRTLTFGGGSASTVDLVQSLAPGGTARVVGHLPSPSSDLAAVAIGDRAYAVGGYDGSVALGMVTATTDGSRMSPIATLPVPVRYAAVASAGHVIYAFGGETSAGADSAAIQEVDVTSGKAKVVGQLPTTLAHASAVTVDGRILILGGREAGSAGKTILAFDPNTGEVKTVGKLPSPITNAAAATAGSRGYLIGGLDATQAPLASIVELEYVQ
ncbi:MAG: hypothetical protein QOI10_397 [Solirubrobacterales bacterium]|nr:hypothetical protein [Solirubrobacterales bacterium]